jgi:hypothetical protein
MTPEDLTTLERAVRWLEHPGFAARLTNMLGKSVELVGDVLPTSARRVIATATSKALQAALKVIPRNHHAGSQFLHKVLATASGAAVSRHRGYIFAEITAAMARGDRVELRRFGVFLCKTPGRPHRQKSEDRGLGFGPTKGRSFL